jgi:exopolysaccharide biosynthesis polyprenyl glycosylphosphotransferase
VYSHNLLLERTQRALVDGIAIYVAVLASVWIRYSSGWVFEPTATPWPSYLFPGVVVAAATVFVLFASGSYSEPRNVGPSPILMGALIFSTVLAITVSFFYREESYSRATVIVFLPVAVLVVTAARFGYDRYVAAVWQTGDAIKNVLIVGSTSSGRQLAKALIRQPAYYKIVGFLDNTTEVGSDSAGPVVLGRISALRATIDEFEVDEVMICLPNDPDQVLDAIGECMRLKVTWRAVPNMYGLRMDRVSVDNFGGVPLVASHGTRLVGFNRTQKRILDVLIASFALILLAPLLLAVAIAVGISSRGPIVFRQTRVGLDGRTFTMLKFRSMQTGTSADIHNNYTRRWIHGKTGASVNGNGSGSLKANDNGSAAVDALPELHKMTYDPRITAVGRMLRAASLDELPQFWNVLRGDMSIVGPRPALPYEVEQYTERHKRRLVVPPGITGAWQVSGRSHLAFEEMVTLDVDYIEHWSLGRDLAIVLRTVPAILQFGGK